MLTDKDLRLEIDKYNLDEEWENQPKQFYVAATEAAKAQERHDLLKRNLKLVVADVELDVKKNYKKYGFTSKPPNQDASNKALTDKKVRLAERKLIKAKRHLDYCYALVNSLEQRKRAIENIVKLDGQNYFAKPIIKGDNEESRKIAEDISKKKARTRKRKQ